MADGQLLVADQLKELKANSLVQEVHPDSLRTDDSSRISYHGIWQDATLEDGIAWAVTEPHTPLTDEEVEFATTGFWDTLRRPNFEKRPIVSGSVESTAPDCELPEGQPTAWELVVEDGVFDVIARDDCTDAQSDLYVARTRRNGVKSATTCRRRAQLAARFNCSVPSPEFLTERLAPAEEDIPAIIQAHKTKRIEELAAEVAAVEQLIVEKAGTQVAPAKLKAFFECKGHFFERKGYKPPDAFLKSNWPIDEATYGELHDMYIKQLQAASARTVSP